jgi:hypothetical protein
MMDGARGDASLVVAHHHPGRLRVRSRTFEEDLGVREGIRRWLSEQPGVRVVHAHAPTGSFLVAYDPSRTDAGALLVGIAARAGLTIAHRNAGEPPARTLFRAARALDARLLASSDGRVGLGVVVPMALGLGSLGSYFWGGHKRAPRWDNLLYWAVQLFVALNGDGARGRDADGP